MKNVKNPGVDRMAQHDKIILRNVSRETFEKVEAIAKAYEKSLECYAQQLAWWNSRINLLSKNANMEQIALHIRHSLYLITELENEKKLVDAGSGGGLPGIPIAIVDSEKNVELVDIVGKKMMACESMAVKCGLSNVKAIKGSIGDYNPAPESVLISKHAFKIPELLKLTNGKGYKKIVLLKGSDYVDEITGLDPTILLSVTRIDAVESNPFFEGKCIVTINQHTQ